MNPVTNQFLRTFLRSCIFILAVMIPALARPDDTTLRASHILSLDDNVIDAARSGEAPDTAVAFSPDETQLAVASYGGWLRVFDTQSGKIVWKKKIHEGLIRCLAYSPDAQTLYAGEVSPDGYFYAINAANAEIKWKIRTADDLGTSPLPATRNRFSLYGLPGVYWVEALSSGTILFSAFHSTFAIDGKPAQKGQLYAASSNGALLWKFPSTRPLDSNIAHFSVSEPGGIAAFGVSGEADIRPSQIMAIDIQTGREKLNIPIPAFEPYFNLVFFWRSIAVSPDGARIAASANDGRAFIFQLNDEQDHSSHPQDVITSQTLLLVQPIQVGGVYLAALAGWCRVTSDTIFVQSQQTVAPMGTSISGDNPPLPHPQANKVIALRKAGHNQWSAAWTWAGQGDLNGLSLDSAGRRAFIIQSRIADPGQNSAWRGGEGIVLQVQSPNGESLPRPRTIGSFAVEGEMYFNSIISPSGRMLAIIETPHWIKSSDTIVGKYQIAMVALPD